MKAKSSVKLLILLCTLAILGLGTASPSQASPVPEAQFYGNLGGSPNGITISSAGTISYNYDYGGEGSYAGTLQLSGGSRPMIDIQMSSFHMMYGMGGMPVASATINYYVRVDKKDPNAPDGLAHLLVSASGSSSVSNGNAWAGGAVWFDGGPYPFIAGNQNWEDSKTIMAMVWIGPNTYTCFSMGAGGQISPFTGNVEFQVVIDPMIQIDPNWMVDYNGQNVPGSQLYSLSMSDGFTAVPLPSALLLFGSALGCLALVRRRPQ